MCSGVLIVFNNVIIICFILLCGLIVRFAVLVFDLLVFGCCLCLAWRCGCGAICDGGVS